MWERRQGLLSACVSVCLLPLSALPLFSFFGVSLFAFLCSLYFISFLLEYAQQSPRDTPTFDLNVTLFALPPPPLPKEDWADGGDDVYGVTGTPIVAAVADNGGAYGTCLHAMNCASVFCHRPCYHVLFLSPFLFASVPLKVSL